VAGSLRFFADRFGIPRASIDGTQLAPDLLRRHATLGAPAIAYDARRRTLVRTRRATYFGFELERDVEALDQWGDEDAAAAERALAEAMARSEARHLAVRRNGFAVEQAREVWRRSGGRTPRLGERELADLYAEQLRGVRSLEEFRQRPLRLDLDALVPPAERERYLALPDVASLRGRDVELQYDVETGEDGAPYGVVRLRLPEKLARTLVDEELPVLDRPVRFVVMRGPRGAVRADSLAELQDKLDLPWSPDEAEDGSGREGRRDGPQERAPREFQRRERDERTTANAIHRHSRDDAGRGRRGPGGRGPGGPGPRRRGR
jgi:hypothetical protein